MKFKFIKKENVDKLPQTTGVYCFTKVAKTGSSQLLYIGKAVNIRQRVKNHFNQPVFKDSIFLPKTNQVGYIETNSEIEALLLEAQLIKQYLPKYNSVWKDGKSHSFVFITKENFPRVFLAHETETLRPLPQGDGQRIGPFIEGLALKQTLRLLRKVFPFRTCRTLPKKVCLYKELGLCLAPCQLKVHKIEYRKNIRSLKAVLEGKKTAVLKGLKKEMQTAAKEQNFEKAKELRDKVFALEKTFANARILQKEKTLENENNKNANSFKALQNALVLKERIERIEGYDVSNIQGKQATGAMVVFEKGLPNKAEYKKFKIKTLKEPNDVGMLKEILTRRLNHPEWKRPQVILIDGGKAQLNCAIKVAPPHIKIMSLAKRNNELFLEGKQKPLLLKDLPPEVSNLILCIRDEAHKFALTYHKKLRSKNLLQ